MMDRVTYTQPAGPDERFAPDAFDSQIGKEVPVNYGTRPYENDPQRGKIVSVVVAPDGKSVEITVEVDLPDRFFPAHPAGSFGFASD